MHSELQESLKDNTIHISLRDVTKMAEYTLTALIPVRCQVLHFVFKKDIEPRIHEVSGKGCTS